MSVIDPHRVNASLTLQSGHYTFPRAAKLRNAFADCLHDYYVMASIGGHFEVRGMPVTGESRVSKTSETVRLVEKFNASMTEMPNGKVGKIIYCKLDGLITWRGSRSQDTGSAWLYRASAAYAV